MRHADAGGRRRVADNATRQEPEQARRGVAGVVYGMLAALCVFAVNWLVGRVLGAAPVLLRALVEIPIMTPVMVLLLRGVRDRRGPADAADEVREQPPPLTQREQELTFIADHLPAQIALIDRALRYRFVNSAAAASLGLTPPQIIGRSVREVVGEERLQSRMGYLQRALAGERVEYETKLVSPGPEERFGLVTFVPYRAAGGEVEGTVILVVDITERRRAEAEAREQAARLTTTLDSLTTAFMTVDRAWRLTFMNRAAEAAVGRRREEVLGQDAFATFPKVVGSQFEEQYEMSMRENQPVSFTAYYPPHDQWYEVNTFPSEQGLALYFRDVTARRKAEEALRQSEASMALAQRVAKFGSWEVELTDGPMPPEQPLRWSDEAFRIAGLLPQSFEPTLADFLKAVHPDDRVRVTDAWAAAVANRTHYALDHRFILPNGDERLVHQEAEIFEPGAEGGPAKAVGTVRDITEETRAAEALRASDERFRATFEQAPVGICEIDAEGRFSRVNRRLCEMFGYPEAELLELNFAEVTHPEDLPTSLRLVGELHAGTRSAFDVDKRYLQKHGGIVWAHSTVTLLQPAIGAPPTLLAIVEDITARKLADETRRLKAAILDSTGEAALATRMDGSLLYFNRAAELLFGWSRREALGGNVLELTMAEAPPAKAAEIMTRMADGGSWTGEFTVQRPDGPHFPVQVTTTPLIDASGEAIAIIAVAADISERKRAQAELERSEEQLRALSARLERLREEDRTRIAREIHDELGQMLTGIAIDLRWLESHVEEWAQPMRAQALDRIVEAGRVVDETMKTVQAIAADLRPGVLDKLGLIAALEYEARRFRERMGVTCVICQAEALPPLSPEVTTALFRIFQECLTNVARHAGATQVRVNLSASADEINFSVEDNGRGLREGDVERSTSLGLLGIKERVTLLGGGVRFGSANEQGTAVSVRLPCGPP